MYMYAVCRGTGHLGRVEGTCETLWLHSSLQGSLTPELVLPPKSMRRACRRGRMDTLKASRLVQIFRNERSGPHTLNSA
jgi:hypothetical protein